MAIHSNGISITNFVSIKSGEDSPWHLEFQRVGSVLRISMHWGDNPEPANAAVVNYDEFISQVTKI